MSGWDQEWLDEQGAEYGDPRRCPKHPNQRTSSNDGMHDCPCPQCEAEMDDAGDEVVDEYALYHLVFGRKMIFAVTACGKVRLSKERWNDNDGEWDDDGGCIGTFSVEEARQRYLDLIHKDGFRKKEQAGTFPQQRRDRKLSRSERYPERYTRHDLSTGAGRLTGREKL